MSSMNSFPKIVNSSWFEPSITGTRLNCPLSRALLIGLREHHAVAIRPDRTRKLRLGREHGLDRQRAQARLGLVLAAPHRVSECQAAALGVRQ